MVAGAKLLAQLPVDSRRGPHAVKLAAAADAAVLDVAAAAETNRPVVRHDGVVGTIGRSIWASHHRVRYACVIATKV